MIVSRSAIEGPTLADVEARILSDRAERVKGLLDDLLGELGDDDANRFRPLRKRRAPDVDQAIVEAHRIRQTLTVRYLTGEEAFANGTNGVCLLGEDHDEALLLGHLGRDTAAHRAVLACMDLCGMTYEDHMAGDLKVQHEWGVFEDCSYDDYSDWAWWFHRTGAKQFHAVAVTRVQLV